MRITTIKLRFQACLLFYWPVLFRANNHQLITMTTLLGSFNRLAVVRLLQEANTTAFCKCSFRKFHLTDLQRVRLRIRDHRTAQVLHYDSKQYSGAVSTGRMSDYAGKKDFIFRQVTFFLWHTLCMITIYKSVTYSEVSMLIF